MMSTCPPANAVNAAFVSSKLGSSILIPRSSIHPLSSAIARNVLPLLSFAHVISLSSIPSASDAFIWVDVDADESFLESSELELLSLLPHANKLTLIAATRSIDTILFFMRIYPPVIIYLCKSPPAYCLN